MQGHFKDSILARSSIIIFVFGVKFVSLSTTSMAGM
jgi:hypothetical protein